MDHQDKSGIAVSDRLLVYASFAVLFLPFLIFVCTHLVLSAAVPVVLLLAAGLFFLIRNGKGGKTVFMDRSTLLLLVFLVLLASFLAGQGGYFPQKSDHHWRNAMLYDLTVSAWPVTYGGAYPGKLCYYFLYWLVPAGIGKCFLPLGVPYAVEAAHFALFLWTALFLFLTVLLAAVTLKDGSRRSVLLSFPVLLLFSGMDCIGHYFAKGTFLENHLEWWCYCQYSSQFTQLAWVFNQAVPAWLCMVLFLRERGCSRYGVIGGASFIFSPIPTVGLGFLMIFSGIGHLIRLLKKRIPLLFLKEVFSPENLLILLAVVPVMGFFYLSNGTVAGSGSGEPFLRMMNFYNPVVRALYFLFVLLEFLLIALLVRKEVRFSLWIGSVLGLLLLPVYRIGSDDFCMRASIPLLFVLAWGSARFFLRDKEKSMENRLRTVFLGGILLIGCVTPAVEIVSSAMDWGKHPHRLDGIVSFANWFPRPLAVSGSMTNFITRNDAPFFRILARSVAGDAYSEDNEEVSRILAGQPEEEVILRNGGLSFIRNRNWIFAFADGNTLGSVREYLFSKDEEGRLAGSEVRPAMSHLGRVLPGRKDSVLIISLTDLPPQGFLMIVSGGILSGEEAGKILAGRTGQGIFGKENITVLDLEKLEEQFSSRKPL